MRAAQRVNPEDIEQALKRVEEKCGPETANLLRAYIQGLEGMREIELEEDPYSGNITAESAESAEFF
jgi:hypothetical protein